jgi:hypothetical protein
MSVQHAQRGEHIGGDLRRPVRAERLLREEGRKRPRRDTFAHYPERTPLCEDVEDLVQARVIGYPRRGLRGLDGPPHRRIRGPACRTPLGRLPRHSRPGRTVRVEDLSVHDLR